MVAMDAIPIGDPSEQPANAPVVPAPALQPSQREIVFTHFYDAPRDVLFRAFTERDHVRHWWGPFGFKNTIHEMSVLPGGVWRCTMHGPDGTDYPNVIHYREVVPPQRLTYRHGSGVPGEPEFDMEVTFVGEDGGTRVTLRQTHESAARADEVKRYAIEGGRQTLTRLEGYLGTMRERIGSWVIEGSEATPIDTDFVFARVFEAPRDLVWRVMTMTAHLERWFGPAGMKMRVVSSELRPGGQFRYAMKVGESEMFGRFVYRELARPERLAYVVSFTDAHFEPARHPLSPSWPLELLAISSLTDFDGKTVLFGRSLPIHATEEECQTFKAGHPSLSQGLQGTYDQLAKYLKSVR